MKENTVGFLINFNTEKAMKNSKSLLNEVKNLGNAIQQAFQASAVITFGLAVKDVTEQMIRATKAESEYIENMNLLKVSYHEGAEGAEELLESADSLVTTMKNFYGLDPSGIVKSLGVYKQMANAMDMTNETSALLGENLIKMQEDVSSLYNLDVETVSRKFQSALAGQTRAVRDLGVDITKTALQQELYNRGINKDIDDMNRASKTVLIYLTMERQLAEAQGDAGRTINGVANQTRIFSEQIKIASRQLGAVFLPVLKTILPYLNGFLMALNAIGEVILSLLGVDVDKLSSEFGISTASGLNDVEESALGASEAVDALNGKLRGFDKLNVITTPKDKSNSYGLGAGGVDSDLLNSMKEYSNLLGDVKNKAYEVRNAILQWLGFTIDENGEINGFKITLGTIIGALVVGGVLWKGVTAIYNIFKALGGMLGVGGLVGKGISGISSALKGTGGVSKQANALKVPDIKTVLTGLADIALIIIGLWAIVEVVGLLMKIPGAKETMSDGLNTIKDMFTTLGSVAIQIGAFSVLIVGLGLVSPLTVLSGMVGLVLIIGGLEAIIVALGWVFSNETVRNLHSGGKEILFDLADTLGGFAGKIISGFADKATEGIEKIGTHLANFMENAKPFFEGLKGIDESTLNSTKMLSSSLLEITGANFLNNVNDFFSLFTGENSLESFGREISDFADYMVIYADKISGLNNDVVIGSTNSAKALVEVATLVPHRAGLAQLFTGSQNLARFGKELQPFGHGMLTYYWEIKDIKSDVIEASANSAKALIELATLVPHRAGLWQLLGGSQNLGRFGKELQPFGHGMLEYYWEVKDIQSTVIEGSANSAKALTELASLVPEQSGLAQLFTGNHSLSKFGETLVDFGKSFKEYADDVSNIGTDKVNQVSEALRSIVDLAVSIKNNEVGDTFKNLGDSLSKSSTGLDKFFSKSNANSIGKEFGSAIGSSIANALKNTSYPTIQLKGDGMSTVKYKISAYAGGGFPDMAELFFANENGIPEMVGRIGNKTAVANNDQIVEAISIGVARAMSSAKSNQTVNIIADSDTEGLLNFITFKQQQRDRQYGF